MNFDDTPAEAAFRAEVRAWIDANAPKHLRPALENAGFGGLDLDGVDPMVVAKAWQKKKAEAGWACLHWPKEYGGRGATPIERVIWGQEEGPYGALGGIFIIGHGMCGPTMMAFASEEQKRRYLPPLAAGEEIWCQLFSEPAGGSDLAGLRTRAEKATDGSGDWIINGQKIWTSGAHYSDYGHPDHPHRPHRAQAQGPDHVLPRHEEPRDRDPPDQAGQRPVGLQRGLFHRRAHPRRPAPGRGGRRLEGLADHPDERAAVDRLGHVHRLSGALRPLLPPRDRQRPGGGRSGGALQARHLGRAHHAG